MIPEKVCKDILVDQFNDYDQATGEDKQIKWGKLCETVKDLTCDDLLKDTMGNTRFAEVSMEYFKEAGNVKNCLEEKLSLVENGIKIAANGPGNARIGNSGLNSKCKDKPDLISENNPFAQRKHNILQNRATYCETRNPDSNISNLIPPYPPSSSSKREE